LIIFVLGIFLGGWVLRGEISVTDNENGFDILQLYRSDLVPSPPKLFNTKLVSYDPSTEDVEIELNALSKINLRGKVNEPAVQKVLAYALQNDQRSGLRLEVIKLLEKNKNNKGIRDVLIYSLQNDPNPGVRLNALKALKGMERDDEINKAFVIALQEDGNPGIRIEAIEGLSNYINENGMDIIKEKAEHDDNLFIKMKAGEILRNIESKLIEELK